MPNVNTANTANTEAQAIAKFVENGGAIAVMPSRTATGGASKQRHTVAPVTPSAATQQAVNTLANVAATAVAQAATQAANVALPKAHTAQALVAKPTLQSLTYISQLANNPVKGLRAKLWANYSVGVTLAHAKASNGLCPLQVMFYAQHGLAKVNQATPAMLNAAIAAWQGGTLPALLASWAQGGVPSELSAGALPITANNKGPFAPFIIN